MSAMKTLPTIVIGLILGCGAIVAAAADDYPSRPITMVVPFAAGGPTDVVGRLLAEHMGRTLGQNVIVEDVTGAAGSIGVGRVARATADGYTLSIGHWSTHVVNGAIYALPYDLLRDFEPIAQLPANPMLVVSRNTLPAKNLTELVAWIKTNPSATIATAGVGSGSHISGVYFQNLTGTHLQFVPYRGTDPALLDLMAGRIDMMFDQVSEATQRVRDNQIRAFAVTAKTRLKSLPDIPDRGRGRTAGPLHQYLVWPVGAERHAARHHRKAQSRRCGRHGGSGRAKALCRFGPRRAIARSAERGGARRAATRRDREVVADHQGRRHQGGVMRAPEPFSNCGRRRRPQRRLQRCSVVA